MHTDLRLSLGRDAADRVDGSMLYSSGKIACTGIEPQASLPYHVSLSSH